MKTIKTAIYLLIVDLTLKITKRRVKRSEIRIEKLNIKLAYEKEYYKKLLEDSLKRIEKFRL